MLPLQQSGAHPPQGDHLVHNRVENLTLADDRGGSNPSDPSVDDARPYVAHEVVRACLRSTSLRGRDSNPQPSG
jgi:hypothetical protein